MNDNAATLIRQTIDKWHKTQQFTYQKKDVNFSKSPIAAGEVLMTFSNTLHGFRCNNKEIPISLTSKIFHTTTLSDSAISDNINADSFRLEKFLNDFDEKFDLLIENKLSECEDILYTSDPLFFR